MNYIPSLDLTQQYANLSPEINPLVQEILASGNYIGGKVIEDFEQSFAEYLGAEYCIGCNSGTDALFLALRSLNIGPGDEVITTPFTFFATTEVISAVGAKPVFVDIDPDTYNFDLEQVEKAITSQTKAIMPVHLFGQPVDMTRLMAIAQQHHLLVIEDCAQSTGSSWQGQKTGTIGHIGCFSFFPTKNLGACGDAGAVITNDENLANQVKILKNHGQSARYYYQEIGINSRLDAIQAAILKVKLGYLDQWNSQRQKIAENYQQLCQNIPYLTCPQTVTNSQSVWNQYTIKLNYSAINPDLNNPASQTKYRDELRQKLQNEGIGTMVYYPIPLHLQPVYQNLGYPVGSLPIAEAISHQVLSLPMFPELSLSQQETIVNKLKDCFT
ncbi:MAG: DegT/DnrJ/EryC1/StrS family aminotransferase [Microcoleaceae cyanobacterium]